ncbi:MAG: sugar transferase [Bacteroidia bacterium]
MLSREVTDHREQLIRDEFGIGVYELIHSYADLKSKHTVVHQTRSHFEVKSLDDNYYDTYINLERINDIKQINKFFEAVNAKLPVDGIFIGCVETSRLREARILKKYPRGISDFYYFLDFLIKRVFPKLPMTKKIYFLLTEGRNRVLSKTEALGRLYSCGFELLLEKAVGINLYFFVKKSRPPYFDKNASYGPIFKMKRVGKNGKTIYCYKFRTMHPYSEYLQEYVYKQKGLVKGDKIKDDPRVTTLGKIFRKYWIDELPMIYNLLKGDIKIVGVRPLSQHKLSLYEKDLVELRLATKPGLVPPYYADMPDSFQGLMDSERMYISAYKKAPFLTDIKYFFKAFYNIIFKKARSK